MGPPGEGETRGYLISHDTFTGSGSGDVPILLRPGPAGAECPELARPRNSMKAGFHGVRTP